MTSRFIGSACLVTSLLITAACSSSDPAQSYFPNSSGGAAASSSGGAGGGGAVGGAIGGMGVTGGMFPTGGVGAMMTGGAMPTGGVGAMLTGGVGATTTGGVGATTTGGVGATTTGGVGATTTGGMGTGSTGTGGEPADPLGGYHVHGDWAGFAFAFADGGATVSPEEFDAMIDQDGPYCIKGTVQATSDYTSIAAVGVNVSQPKIEDADVNTIMASGTGLLVDFTVKSGADGIRVQIEGADGSVNENHRWCVNLTGSQSTVIPWDTFNTACWSAEEGVDFNPASDELAKVIFYVPDAGSENGSAQDFDFCLNDVGPDNVTGRGEGEIVASCGNNVSWAKTSTNQQFENIATSDNKYQFQSNGWGWTGGGHSISLLSGCGFKMDSQSCSRSDDSPCSFPSIYVGTDADGTRTSGNGLPAQVSAINSIPTCLGWSSGGTPASDEYNVSYDVWFNSSSGANGADVFLMVWLRDPPSFQPAGQFPVQDGVVIGSQTWSVWHGPNANNQMVVSYAAPNHRADGQAYSFDLKDFIDDAVEREFIDANKYLIAIMGGLEIWGGAQGASITGFRAQVQ
ncbi:MAG: hypothetical protein JW751_20615 [Polyangiaceae bacterium]|nr:hypothetical protein [Polyangiaceae bacterium]